MNCPKCDIDVPNEEMCGIEHVDVYDGISFWRHNICGTVWSRWTGEIVPDFDKLSHAEIGVIGRTQKYRFNESCWGNIE